MLRLAALVAAVAVHPVTVPDFVQWGTHAWDAYGLARSSSLRVAVGRRFVIAEVCSTAVVSQDPAPRAAVKPGTVLHLRVAATCRPSRFPGAAPAPQLIGAGAAAAVSKLQDWGDNWAIEFPALPPARAQYLYDAYRIVSERMEDGVLRLDAALVRTVVRETCPVLGLDTATTYRRRAKHHRLRASAASSIALAAARPYVSTSVGRQPPGPLRVGRVAPHRVGACIEWAATVTGKLFDLPLLRQIPFAVGPVPVPLRSLQVVIADSSSRVLAVLDGG